jgi:hypothetical protein
MPVMENRNGLAVDGTVTQASGTAERRASEAMLKKKAKRSGRRITVGEDKAYDTSDHVAALREMNITPHVAQNDSLTKTGKHRSSAIDGRTTRHIGYRISQCRAMSECIFGWGKQHGTMRKTKHRDAEGLFCGYAHARDCGVESGASRREVAEHYDVSASTAVLGKVLSRDGPLQRQAARREHLAIEEEHAEFLLALIDGQS